MWLTFGKLLLANWQAVALAGALAFIWIQGQRIDNLKEQAGGYERSIAAYEDAAVQADAALQQCVGTNEANAIDRERFRQAAQDATLRASRLAAELMERERQIPETLEVFHEDQECRTLADPLPDDFIDRLRDP